MLISSILASKLLDQGEGEGGRGKGGTFDGVIQVVFLDSLTSYIFIYLCLSQFNFIINVTFNILVLLVLCNFHGLCGSWRVFPQKSYLFYNLQGMIALQELSLYI